MTDQRALDVVRVAARTRLPAPATIPAQGHARGRYRGRDARAHRAISHLKAWRHGTHRWASREHTQVYLDEVVFRYNRRRNPLAAFQRLLGLAAEHAPTTRRDIVAQGPGQRPRKNQTT